MTIVNCLARMLTILSLFGMTSGCSVFYLAKRTVKYEPREYDITLEEAEACEQYAIWAEEAWSEYQGRNPEATDAEYYDGFRSGFVDFCFAGGSGEPPPIPPRRFWRTMYRNTIGDQAIAEWSAGFRAGADAARTGGYRKRAVVPSPASQHNTAIATSVPHEIIHALPSETFDDVLDADELLEIGPELIGPEPGILEPESLESERPQPIVPEVQNEDPYLKSPLEDLRPDEASIDPPGAFAKPLPTLPAVKTRAGDGGSETEPKQLRYEDFFRAPDERDAAEDEPANRLGFSPATDQVTYAAESTAVTEKSTNSREKSDRTAGEANAVTARSTPKQKEPRKRSAKNATEWAKHAQTLFQDPDEVSPIQTPYSGLYSEQP